MRQTRSLRHLSQYRWGDVHILTHKIHSQHLFPFNLDPSSPGLNSLNFLLSASQPPASLALNPSSVPTLALPYILLPSAALSHYPLVASSLPQQGSDSHNKLSFSLPAVMSPAHFMVGTVPYGLAAASEMSRSPVPSPSTPEHSRLYVSAAGTPHSPSGPRQTVSISTPEPLVRTACAIVAPPTNPNAQISLNFNIFSLDNDTWPLCSGRMSQRSLTREQVQHLFCGVFPLIYPSRRYVCWFISKLLNGD